nr:sugar-transfer associated ATP-grasp domain-containing protein [Glutamicibacter soli]
MLNNKIACNEVLRHHIRVPHIQYVKNKGRLVALSDTSTAATTDEVLSSLQTDGSYFLKPLAAGKGKGVHRLDYRAGSYLLDGKPADAEVLRELMNHQDGWFLSEAIEQHRLLASVFSGATNTLRMITMRNAAGQSELFFVVLRLGTASTIPVDNGSRGGLVAKVELDTGVLSHATSLWSTAEYASHPDTGARIEGVQLPDWERLCRQILDLADCLPYLQFVAWDVLLTEEGPVVIEANTSSGVNIIQVWGPERNHRLGDFYRMHKVIK